MARSAATAASALHDYEQDQVLAIEADQDGEQRDSGITLNDDPPYPITALQNGKVSAEFPPPKTSDLSANGRCRVTIKSGAYDEDHPG